LDSSPNSPAAADDRVPGLDPVAAARWLRLPRTHSPWLHEEVASRMVERLQWFREAPTSWLHWEPLLGGLQGHARVRAALPDARCQVFSHDLTHAVHATREAAARSWNPLRRPRDFLPGQADPEQPVGLLWANMGLHTEPSPQALLAQWHRHLAPGGFLLMSCLGPDSLSELREVYLRSGWPAATHAFTDLHDWGDMLVQAGFAEPVMDMERLTLTYGSAQAMLDDLRQMGRNLASDRFAALRGRGWRRALLEGIERHGARDTDGRLRLGFEIIYGHAVKAEPRARSGQTTLPLDEVREQLKRRRG
jgi:malonyl-CoA O-methyltransferase